MARRHPTPLLCALALAAAALRMLPARAAPLGPEAASVGPLAAASAPEPPGAGFQVVKFAGSEARLRVGSEATLLRPGSPPCWIPADAVTSVLSGEVWALVGGALIVIGPGDAVIFHAQKGRARLFVAAGKVKVIGPGRARATLAAGQHEDFPVESEPSLR